MGGGFGREVNSLDLGDSAGTANRGYNYTRTMARSPDPRQDESEVCTELAENPEFPCENP